MRARNINCLRIYCKCIPTACRAVDNGEGRRNPWKNQREKAVSRCSLVVITQYYKWSYKRINKFAGCSDVSLDILPDVSNFSFAMFAQPATNAIGGKR